MQGIFYSTMPAYNVAENCQKYYWGNFGH